MQIFKLNHIRTAPALDQGVPINGADSIMWVERYRDAGEFEIVAKASSNIRALLPLGSLISHTKTLEIMMVENHETQNKPDEDATVKITGRSLEAWLENRVVGADFYSVNPSANLVDEYTLASNYTPAQAIALVNDFIKIGTVVDANDGLQYLEIVTSLGNVGTQEERNVPRKDVHAALLEILEVEDLGIKVIRRTPNPPTNGSATNHRLVVHKGANRKNRVIFSAKGGDLSQIDYFWTNRKLKNDVLVVGRYIETRVSDGSISDYDRRTLVVDASDIDGWRDAAPTGTALTNTLNRMVTRGRQALRKQKERNIVRADVAPISRFEYRKDYNIGDLVTVSGEDGIRQSMRVTEHAEIIDGTGFSSHPTLELPEE